MRRAVRSERRVQSDPAVFRCCRAPETLPASTHPALHHGARCRSSHPQRESESKSLPANTIGLPPPPPQKPALATRSAKAARPHDTPHSIRPESPPCPQCIAPSAGRHAMSRTTCSRPCSSGRPASGSALSRKPVAVTRKFAPRVKEAYDHRPLIRNKRLARTRGRQKHVAHKRRSSQFHRRNFAGHDQLPRMDGRWLGHLVLASQGLYPGLHHGTGLHGRAAAGIREAQLQDHRLER